MFVKKINNEVINPISVPKIKASKIKGFELFPEVYSNVFLCARKKSGKTNAINKILYNCVGKNTHLFFFASTINKDDNLKHIIKTLRKKGNTITKYTSIKNEDKVDILQTILDTLKNENNNEEEEEVEVKYIEVDEDNDEKKPRKPRKIAPEIIFVMDDLGGEINIPSINTLLKTNRHYKCKVIISSQYPHDLSPQARRQLDYCILFGGHSEDKLKILFIDLDLDIAFDKFVHLYKDATKEKYNFLYVDVKETKFRKNFNMEYIIKDVE